MSSFCRGSESDPAAFTGTCRSQKDPYSARVSIQVGMGGKQTKLVKWHMRKIKQNKPAGRVNNFSRSGWVSPSREEQEEEEQVSGTRRVALG